MWQARAERRPSRQATANGQILAADHTGWRRGPAQDRAAGSEVANTRASHHVYDRHIPTGNLRRFRRPVPGKPWVPDEEPSVPLNPRGTDGVRERSLPDVTLMKIVYVSGTRVMRDTALRRGVKPDTSCATARGGRGTRGARALVEAGGQLGGIVLMLSVCGRRVIPVESCCSGAVCMPV